ICASRESRSRLRSWRYGMSNQTALFAARLGNEGQVLGYLPTAVTDPDPRRLVRRGDSGGSAEAAVRVVESGAETSQVPQCIALVVSLPGRTSAELARETADVGARLGFDAREWRYVLGRRLSAGEDRGRGPIVGVEHRFVPERPWRR